MVRSRRRTTGSWLAKSDAHDEFGRPGFRKKAERSQILRQERDIVASPEVKPGAEKPAGPLLTLGTFLLPGILSPNRRKTKKAKPETKKAETPKKTPLREPVVGGHLDRTPPFAGLCECVDDLADLELKMTPALKKVQFQLKADVRLLTPATPATQAEHVVRRTAREAVDVAALASKEAKRTVAAAMNDVKKTTEAAARFFRNYDAERAAQLDAELLERELSEVEDVVEVPPTTHCRTCMRQFPYECTEVQLSCGHSTGECHDCAAVEKNDETFCFTCNDMRNVVSGEPPRDDDEFKVEEAASVQSLTPPKKKTPLVLRDSSNSLLTAESPCLSTPPTSEIKARHIASPKGTPPPVHKALLDLIKSSTPSFFAPLLVETTLPKANKKKRIPKKNNNNKENTIVSNLNPRFI